MDFKFIRNVDLDGKIIGKIGSVDGERVYLTKRNQIFNLYNGFAIQKNILWKIFEEKVTKVIVLYKEKRYDSIIEDWFENSTPVELGHGEQLALSRDFMREHVGEL